MGKKNKNKNKKKSKRNLNDKAEEVENEVEDTAAQEDDDQEPAEQSLKRQHQEDGEDSDNEDKPKKKKKKKLPTYEEGPDKKGKKSIRQIKREKYLQRQAEAQAASQDNLKSQCLTYLSQWKHAKQNWKFMKVKQIWLFKNKFSDNLIPDASWPILLEYFESAKGNIRNVLLEDANKVIKEMDEWTESQDKETKETEELESNPDSNKPSQVSYKRARDLIQSLQ